MKGPCLSAKFSRDLPLEGDKAGSVGWEVGIILGSLFRLDCVGYIARSHGHTSIPDETDGFRAAEA
jgi:hypothetical protein